MLLECEGLRKCQGKGQGERVSVEIGACSVNCLSKFFFQDQIHAGRGVFCRFVFSTYISKVF